MKILYRAVMDENTNSLRSLPLVQRFQVMVFLSLMWSTIFSAAAGAWLWYDELMVGHVLFLLGVFLTALTFRSATRSGKTSPATYRDHPLEDGTARYDDVWGA